MNLESAWWHAYNQQSKNEAICWRMSHLPRLAAYLNSNALPPSIMNTPPAWQMGNTSSVLVSHSSAIASDSTSTLSQREVTEQARRGPKLPVLQASGWLLILVWAENTHSKRLSYSGHAREKARGREMKAVECGSWATPQSTQVPLDVILLVHNTQ